MNTQQEARVWLIGMIFLLAMPLLALEPEKKAQVPYSAAQAEAMKLVKEVYGNEYKSAKTVTQKITLADKLLQKAAESKADPANHYVLLKLARDIAAQAGEADLALRAVDEMASAFQVDAYAMKVETLVKAAKAASVARQYPVIAERAKALLDESIGKDDFDSATQLAETAITAAKRGKDLALVKQMVNRHKEVEGISTAYAEVKEALAILEKKPADPAANLAVGKYLCFFKGQWDKGLPKLALGNEEAFKALAVKELEGTTDANAQAALGDGWWELAEKEEGRAKGQLQGRAAYWYKQAMPGLAGLVKDKVEKRINEVDYSRPELQPVDIPAKPVDLLSLLSLTGSFVWPEKPQAEAGQWKRTRFGIKSSPTGVCCLQLPCVAPREYKLRLVAVRRSGTSAFNIGLTSPNGRTFAVSIDAWGDGTISALTYLDGRGGWPGNPTYFKGCVLPKNKAIEIECEVRERRVRISCDGRAIMDWAADYERLKYWSAPNPQALFIASWSSIEITKLQIVPLAGKLRLEPHDNLRAKP